MKRKASRVHSAWFLISLMADVSTDSGASAVPHWLTLPAPNHLSKACSERSRSAPNTRRAVSVRPDPSKPAKPTISPRRTLKETSLT